MTLTRARNLLSRRRFEGRWYLAELRVERGLGVEKVELLADRLRAREALSGLFKLLGQFHSKPWALQIIEP